jgi:chorismate dehydratase
LSQPSVRLGAVGYLNSRPLVYGLDRSPRFAVRYDVPSKCAALLHEGGIDVGLIPSIEYQRGDPYRIVPDLAIASNGPVASVAIYTTRPMRDVASIALDTSSRTSAALVRVLCERLYAIRPSFDAHGPDLSGMLERADAALIIGDNALFLDERADRLEKIDLGDAWKTMTGLPFVFAFWAGRAGALTSADVRDLQRARDEGMERPAELARAYLPDQPERHEIAARYLQDNIKYHLGDDERAGLELFYRYAAEAGIVDSVRPVQFFGQV